jgi:hypothetical protein
MLRYGLRKHKTTDGTLYTEGLRWLNGLCVNLCLWIRNRKGTGHWSQKHIVLVEAIGPSAILSKFRVGLREYFVKQARSAPRIGRMHIVLLPVTGILSNSKGWAQHNEVSHHCLGCWLRRGIEDGEESFMLTCQDRDVLQCDR